MPSPMTVECPHCQARLRIAPEKAGRKIRCPKCSESFVADSDDESADFDDEEVRQPARRGSSSKKSGTKRSKKSKKGGQLPLPALIGGGVAALFVLGLVVFLLSPGRKGGPQATQVNPQTTDGAATTAATAASTTPGLRRALKELPAWLIKDAPFDVKQFWVSVPADQNAATLYLDALYEFSPHMQDCFPASNRAQQTAAIKKRRERSDLLQRGRGNPRIRRDNAERDAVLKVYAGTLEALRTAQQRPRCVFEIGWDFPSFAPVIDAAREAARVAELQVEQDIEKGDFSAAIRRIDAVLRLSRDLRVRTPSTVQYSADAMETLSYQAMVIPVLKSPAMPLGDCDELLKTLQRHAAALRGINPLLTSLQADYVLRVMLIHGSPESLRTRICDRRSATTPVRAARRCWRRSMIQTNSSAMLEF